MPDIEERPSKIRKLDSPEVLQDSAQQPSEVDVEIGGEHSNGREVSQSEEHDLSKIELQETSKDDPPLSKSQLKKRRREEAWIAAKDLRKGKRRDKRHEKQARKAEQRAELQDKIAKGEIEPPVISPEELAKKRQRPVLLPITLIIDCDFNELMTEKELISLGAQLTRCYSDNRHSKYRAHMVMSSWNGALRTRFETVLTNHHKGWKGVGFLEKGFVGAAEELDGVMRGPNGGNLVGALAPIAESKAALKSNDIESAKKLESSRPAGTEDEKPFSEDLTGQGTVEDALDQVREDLTAKPLSDQPSSAPELMVGSITTTIPDSSSQPQASTRDNESSVAPTEIPFSEPSIVYLTSDSPYTLDRLSPNTSYIIGGIVDKNRHKGLCYKRACQLGIPTAKLPIGEYMTMQSRSVLAVNHVVEIMLKWLETGDWGEAFLSVIPKRKEAKLRVKKGQNGKEESSNEGDGSVELEDDDGGEVGLNDDSTKVAEEGGVA